MILRYAACKFGWDEDVMRAEASNQTGWQQGGAGDPRTVKADCVQGSFTALYDTAITEPDGSVIPSVPGGCCQSWSLLQTKVFYEWMTWPMIMQDTSFAAEYLGATVRTCMNGGYASYISDVSSTEGATYAADYAAYVANPNATPVNPVPNYYHGTNRSLQQTTTNRMLWGCDGTNMAGYHWYDSTTNPYIQEIQQYLVTRNWPQ
jgi:hypothetical protein